MPLYCECGRPGCPGDLSCGEKMTTEWWKPVKGFEGRYAVSSLGRVCSLPRTTTNNHKLPGRLLRPTKTRSGHLTVDLRRPGGRAVKGVHILVLEAFAGRRPSGTVCCHWDGDPQNNHRTNLRWGTRVDNEADKRRHGTDNAGSRHGLAKLVEEDVIRIREAALFGATQPALAVAYGVAQSRISQIVARKIWRHV